MAYSPAYNTSDLKDIFVDILGSGAVEVVGFAALFVILGVVGFLAARARMVSR